MSENLKQKLKTFGLFFGLYSATMAIFYLALTASESPISSLDGTRLVLFMMVLPLLIKLVLQLVSAIWYSYKEKHHLVQEHTNPKVSVLLPAWNEEVGIVKTMMSVLNSNYQNLQLVVINDGSTDKTDSLVRQFIAQYEPEPDTREIKYLSLPNGGKAKALNEGLELADGEIVITVDADCVMDPDAVENFVQRFNDPYVGAVAGNVIIGNRKKPIELIQQLEYVCGFFFKRADSVFNSVYIIGGAAAAYRRKVLVDLKGFDPELITEDVEMSMRILGHGYKTRYAHNAVIYTEGPSDWKGLCNQRLRWKYGRILTYLRHKELFFSKHHQNPYLSWVILPLAVYSEILLLLQGLLLTFFFAYTFISSDYLPLAIMILFSTVMVTGQILTDSKKDFHSNLLGLAPIAWLLLYAIDFVEFQALVRSLKRLFKRESLKWQKWSRIGIGQQTAKQTI
ncbi:glycosyltransferase family 2 protein [Kangiella sp. TOML190]|uniref:glycosyltransferase n=1 Tax=Kangiella sp. TOML190 TaxID=2931351 RepID=UPI0020407DC8|nr:glycosyltransferase [Kangiella sp. TOML190]